ncbi:MAG: hypothetical protein IPK04_22245 [Bdellovibrionales bacterium]|nr:hypothetical protein [Bdellovibrionales bacterium]
MVFMTQQLLMAKGDAVAYYHSFTAACYLLPIVGAYISDRYLGKYKTIISLSMVYCLGHLVLALFESRLGLLFGLTFIAIGSGGIKPCVSAHVGDQFRSDQERNGKYFNLFYFMINFGTFFCQPSLYSLRPMSSTDPGGLWNSRLAHADCHSGLLALGKNTMFTSHPQEKSKIAL